MTALHFAASSGFLNIATLLINNGCNVNVADSNVSYMYFTVLYSIYEIFDTYYRME